LGLESAVIVGSSVEVRFVLLRVELASLEVGDEAPSSVIKSSSSWAMMMGDSSMISVNRLLFLLELMVEVEVEFVRRAMLSNVISFGVDVSRIKS
jgi:hypothetical protein